MIPDSDAYAASDLTHATLERPVTIAVGMVASKRKNELGDELETTSSRHGISRGHQQPEINGLFPASDKVEGS